VVRLTLHPALQAGAEAGSVATLLHVKMCIFFRKPHTGLRVTARTQPLEQSHRTQFPPTPIILSYISKPAAGQPALSLSAFTMARHYLRRHMCTAKYFTHFPAGSAERARWRPASRPRSQIN
jgi:hypothetical protein